MASSALVRDLGKLPNLITLSRIALIGIALGLYFGVSRDLGIGLAVLSGVTDYIDGAVARATGQVTHLGEILDQLADLVFESTLLLLAVTAGFVSPLVLIAYLVREFWISALRRFVATRGRNISSGLAGKLKTNFLMWSFLPAFVSIRGLWPGGEPYLAFIGRYGIWAGLLLSYVSGWIYTRQFLAVYNGPMTGPQDAG